MHLTITMARILIYIYVGVQVRKSWKTPEIRKYKLHKEETYNQSRHTNKGGIHTRRWHKHGGDIYMEHMEKRENIYMEWTYIKITRTMSSPFNIFLSQCLPFSMSSLLTSSPLHVFPSQCLPFSMFSISMSFSVHVIPSTLNVLPSQCPYWPVCWPIHQAQPVGRRAILGGWVITMPTWACHNRQTCWTAGLTVCN